MQRCNTRFYAMQWNVERSSHMGTEMYAVWINTEETQNRLLYTANYLRSDIVFIQFTG